MTKRIILASQSPRRRELLRKMGVDFTVVASDYDENLDDTRSPYDVAIELALGKAREVAERFPDAYVIGSDTIVVSGDGRQLEKPHSLKEAQEMLADHCKTGATAVITSVAIVCKERQAELKDYAEAQVRFKSYTPAVERLIEAYVASGDPLDKAGAYGIQSGAAPIIDYVEGEYDTIIGFPTRVVADLLGQLGVSSRPVATDLPVARRPSR